MVDTILLATDGSDYAQRATAHAIALAKQEQAMLEAVFVVDTRDLGEPALSSVEVLIDEYEDRGREILQEVVEAAETHGLTVETRCCHGEPSQEILQVADAVDADLIVIGERGETHQIKEGEVTRALRQADERVIIA